MPGEARRARVPGAADEAGQRGALTWARRLGADRVWAIEDCRHVSGRLERALVGAGERAVRVAPKLMRPRTAGQDRPNRLEEPFASATLGDQPQRRQAANRWRQLAQGVARA